MMTRAPVREMLQRVLETPTAEPRPATDPLAAAEALASTPFFAGLSSLDLARLVPELEERRFEAGEAVFFEGQASDGLYIIRDGRARVVTGARGAGSTLLACLGPREYFGEMALVSAQPRSATVEAITPLETWRLSAERFRELTERFPSLPLEVAASLSRRLEAANRALSRASGLPETDVPAGEPGGAAAVPASSIANRSEPALADPADDVRDGPTAATVTPPAPALFRRAPSLLRRFPSLRTGLAVLGSLVLGAAWISPPPLGMSQAAYQALLLLLGSLGVSLLGLLPDCVTFLLMLALWASLDIVPTPVAASGFASPTWILMLATMAVSAGLARSGVLYRGVLELLQRLPARYPMLAGALASFGVLLTPGLPYTAGRVALLGPVALDIADSLRYRARSGGVAGLALASFLGSGLMGSLFLTGNPGALILIGLVPGEQRSEISFLSWLLAALPLHLVLFSGTLLFILRRYRPDDEGLSRVQLQLQRAVLGPVRGSEWLALGVLAVLLVGFATTSVHGIEPAWLAVFGVVAMFAGRLLDADTLRRGVNWQLLLYLGVALSLGTVLQTVGLDGWVGAQLGPLLEAARLPSGLVLLGIGALAMLLSLALGTFPAVLLLALPLFPIAGHLGLSPMVLAMTLLVSANQWLYPQQNFVYLSLYSATEQRAFRHAQARPAAIAYALLTLVGIALSVPCWYRLGLLH